LGGKPDSYAVGVGGAIQVYKNSLKNIALSSPSMLCPLITKAMEGA